MRHDGVVAMCTTCASTWRAVAGLWLLLVLGSGAQEENPRIVEHPTDHYVAKNEPAKLHCKAEGNPTPEITWYRNGQRVITNKDDQNAHRLLLNGGNQLFFLRIIHTKNLKPDVGTYYCNATNIHGSAVSRNATLQIAVLRDDFRESPESVTVSTGEHAAFHCKPPRGEPEPKVLWHREGTPVNPDSRIIISPEGDLTISSVKVTDAGKYTCLAINQGGEKESAPASLTVFEKPTFREMPDDIQASVDDTVELKCRASGDPAPSIQWRREAGRIPFGRARQLDDGTLRIEKVQVADDGVYVCVAENSAGTVEAVGRLSVQTLPSFLITPRDISVGRGRTAILECVVTGNPPPTVFWSKGKEQLLMFPHQEHGRFLVSEDGTLRIQSVEYQDEGTYVCQALNSLSSSKVSTVSAVLTVLDQDDRPPPIIMVGPQNLTLESKEVALLHCQAEGNPQPSIRWYKDGKILLNSDPRVVIMNSGTLQISDVRATDSGMYTCKGISETGDTDWIATLSVAKQGPYQRLQKPSVFPGAPSAPRISDVTDTSVHLTWVPSDHIGQSNIHAYVVEYFSPQTSQGWLLASDSVSRDSYTIKDLKPDSKYLFQIRAKNSFGLSPPSPLSDYITTREKRHNFVVSMPREEITREFRALNIELKAGEAINATTVRLKWEVDTSLAAIEGYIINYTQILEFDPVRYGESQAFSITDPYVFKTYITNLAPYGWYEVCVQAYAKDLLSRCSNSIRVPTKESVPVAPPENIVIHKEGNSLHIRWSPPPRQQQNGDIKGYDIYCMVEDTNRNCSTSVGGRDSSAVIFSVDTEGSYRLKLAARTSRGRGVWSKEFFMGSEHSHVISEPWFVWTLVGTIGGTVWLALCVFSVWLCRRRRRIKKKMAQNGMYSAVPVHKSEDPAGAGSLMPREDVVYSQKESNMHAPYGGLQSDLASLLECGHKDGLDGCQMYSAAMSLPHMKTFYQRPGPPSAVAPYATTTLVNKGGNTTPRPRQSSVTDSSFRPINHAYVHSSASGSGDSCQKPELRSNGSTTDSSRPNTGHYSYAAGCTHDHDLCEEMTSLGSDSGSYITDENGMPIKHKYSKIGGCSICLQGKQPVVNWSELLPHPAENPPSVSELGSPVDCPGESTFHCHINNHNNNNSTMIDPRYTDSLISSVSKLSACSCPVPHDSMLSHTHAKIPYSDFDYPTHSGVSHRYHDLAGIYQDGSAGSCGSTYNSDRPYSPKPPGSMTAPHADTLIHRCQSPMSCLSCSGIIQPSAGLQIPPSSSSSASSYSSHYHHLTHHPQHTGTFGSVNENIPGAKDLNDSRGKVCSQMGSLYPQGNVSSAFTQTGHQQFSYNSSYPYTPVALHGYRMPSMEPDTQRNSCDFDQFTGQACPSEVKGHEGSHMLSPASDVLEAQFARGQESPGYEAVTDYVSDTDVGARRSRDCHTPDPSIKGDYCISAAEDDFVSAADTAVELSASHGATDADLDNNMKKKSRKQRSGSRPASTKGADSNQSFLSHKSRSGSHKLQQQQARKYRQRKDGAIHDEVEEADTSNVKT